MKKKITKKEGKKINDAIHKAIINIVGETDYIVIFNTKKDVVRVTNTTDNPMYLGMLEMAKIVK